MTRLGRRRFTALLLGSALGGCGGYEVKNLVKSDIDLVTDEFIIETRLLVRELMSKFYARNPDQLLNGSLDTVEARLSQLQDTPGPLSFRELSFAQEIAALELVFQEEFTGDRVFALIVGLGGMLRRAYGYNTESYLFDTLDSEILSTSARNIEILLWRLKNNRKSTGDPFLISSAYRGKIDNLSFERIFGKLIALEDMMSRIAGDAGDRRVTKVVHTASSVFIPLPI
ncbi:hypothetical protein R0135_00455 [Congregibacter variabilis]|uniref:Lipoprotein n=1 Tax=Congregibacter variabilis TaxID=3081200 RepID=A0ABZ0I2B6_9GAMM|nr:hypothetical protein R0135_00455 [Congregibacter sp. IMCC43200]